MNYLYLGLYNWIVPTGLLIVLGGILIIMDAVFGQPKTWIGAIIGSIVTLLGGILIHFQKMAAQFIQERWLNIEDQVFFTLAVITIASMFVHVFSKRSRLKKNALYITAIFGVLTMVSLGMALILQDI